MNFPVSNLSTVRSTKDSPTQHLRNLIEDANYGAASTEDLHNALMNLERRLNLPLTQPAEEMAA